jgi:hypothetical protein
VRVMVVLGSRVTVTVAPVLVVSWIVVPCTDATVPLRRPPRWRRRLRPDRRPRP